MKEFTLTTKKDSLTWQILGYIVFTITFGIGWKLWYDIFFERQYYYNLKNLYKFLKANPNLKLMRRIPDKNALMRLALGEYTLEVWNAGYFAVVKHSNMFIYNWGGSITANKLINNIYKILIPKIEECNKELDNEIQNRR